MESGDLENGRRYADVGTRRHSNVMLGCPQTFGRKLQTFVKCVSLSHGSKPQADF